MLASGRAKNRWTLSTSPPSGRTPTLFAATCWITRPSEVEAFDTQVGEQLQALQESGEAANTLVMVTSDNGMPFPRCKGHNYDIANHLPLVACWPQGISRPGRKISELDSFIDFAPTAGRAAIPIWIYKDTDKGPTKSFIEQLGEQNHFFSSLGLPQKNQHISGPDVESRKESHP